MAKPISASGLIAVVATCGLLVSACGSSSSSSKSYASPAPTPTKAKVISNVDACVLVTAADASTATGVTVTNLAGATGTQVPGACLYGSSDGTTSVIVIAQTYADAGSANSVAPEQLAAALNGAYGIANAKTVSGIGDKAVEYTVTTAAAGSTGAVIFVFKSNVVIMIAVTPLTDTKKLEDLARTAVGNLH